MYLLQLISEEMAREEESFTGEKKVLYISLEELLLAKAWLKRGPGL